MVLQQSRWASLSLLDCRCLSPNARHAHCRFYGENQKPSTTQKHGNGSCSFNGRWVMMLSWLMADLRTRQKQGRSWANFEFSCLMISSDSSVALDCKILRLRSTKTNSFDRQQVNCCLLLFQALGLSLQWIQMFLFPSSTRTSHDLQPTHPAPLQPRNTGFISSN